MAKTTKQETSVTKSYQFIINKLKENGFDKIEHEIQLFTNQLRDDYSVSINYMSTGVKIHGQDIDESELINDENIRICKTYECII
jgi:hypothetical protein